MQEDSSVKSLVKEENKQDKVADQRKSFSEVGTTCRIKGEEGCIKNTSQMSGRQSDDPGYKECSDLKVSLPNGHQPEKLKGGAKNEKKNDLKTKQFTSKIEAYNNALNLIRSSKAIEQFNNHHKCSVANFCSFCLLRSLMYKINTSKGRQFIVPVEVECQHGLTSETRSNSTMLEQILENAFTANPAFKNAISPSWCCNICNHTLSQDEGMFVNLGGDA